MSSDRYGSRHFVAETWLRDEGRWAMADGQRGSSVLEDGRLLSAAESLDAFANLPLDLRVTPSSGPIARDLYLLSWHALYLREPLG